MGVNVTSTHIHTKKEEVSTKPKTFTAVRLSGKMVRVNRRCLRRGTPGCFAIECRRRQEHARLHELRVSPSTKKECESNQTTKPLEFVGEEHVTSSTNSLHFQTDACVAHVLSRDFGRRAIIADGNS